ncbi:MAG: exodeoxyribonuclease V subunit beta [Deltaproteobacteria bacterium]|nr:exodeoxyribonuclease V subunit beta [Deltaproteobacteria bacterium]
MAAYQIFDPLKIPLEGTNLVEAGAGTGKTYAITGLFLRLLLEKNLAVHQILVVTFTEAATQELKDRIRNKIRDGIAAFSKGGSEDSFLERLVRECPSPAKAIADLQEALRIFDEAAIYTIHGFCRKMLHENAFESGSLFDTELATDPSAMIQECVDDFWRNHFYTVSPLFVNYALEKGFTPGECLSLWDVKMRHPFLRVIPEIGESHTTEPEKRFRESFRRAKERWPSVKDTVAELLSSYEGLNKTHYRPSKVQIWKSEMDDLFSSGRNSSALFPDFKKFSRSELEKRGNLKKDFPPPHHPFFDLCEDLLRSSDELDEAFSKRLSALKIRMFKEVNDGLSKRKRERNVQTFDDLLLKLQSALAGRGGRELAKAIRRKYSAALIDEFQDTDPVQYAIFQEIFEKAEGILFLVGDPKQSIYGFRGADIFAYMEAANKVRSHYTLSENWRSEPRLIEAVNTLFSSSAHPFIYEKIIFKPTTAGKRKEEEFLTVEGRNVPPFMLWFLDKENGAAQEGAIGKGFAQRQIPGLVAAEIVHLLNMGKKGKALIGKRPLEASDIAVLVRQNREAILMKRALSERFVPSVLFSTEKLFDSHEAMETERFLSAVVESTRESLIKGALSLDMLGLKGEELESVSLDEALWEKWLVKFRKYHDLWREQGFISMFRFFLQDEKVMNRLIAFPDGERRNTNLLHLMEVLHRACAEKKLNMTGLLKWVSEQRESQTTRSEEHQLRLESDENAVNLVTIHKSKGLEYPIVFCPFSWYGIRSNKGKEPLIFHDPHDMMQVVLDLGSHDEAHRAMAEREELAENLRLLYVALTRAKCRAYLIWGRFNGAETSAPAYLLHAPAVRNSDNLLVELSETFRKLKGEDLLSSAEAFVKRAGASLEIVGRPDGGIGERFLPAFKGTQIHGPRTFIGRIDHQWKISSFSSLVSARVHGEEETDYDALHFQEPVEPVHMPEEPAGIFAFPKGARAGSFFHDLFEHLDFRDTSISTRQDLVKKKLTQYGYDHSWMDAVCGMMEKVLRVPLEPKREDFTFSRVGSEDRLNEIEFYFPLKSLNPETVGKIMGIGDPYQDSAEKIGRLHFSPLRGFMKGFIDMVFRFEGRYYLVDWKSNYLGSNVEDYGAQKLAGAMNHHFYTLQYTLYTLALNQYLRLRVQHYDYNRHFGGILYIFLRGVDPSKEHGSGIYRARPHYEVIRLLSRELIGRA